MAGDWRDAIEECRCSLELVWDEGMNATAFTEEGAPIRIGPAANLTPQQLLAMAASSCLMTTLFRLAAEAGVSVEGYVSSARLRQRPGRMPELALAPCVVVATDEAAARIERLWDEAIQRSPTLRLLSPNLQVEPVVRIVPPV